MSILFAALNPNINSDQLSELIKKDGESKVRMIEHFGVCVQKIETEEQRSSYINACLPVLIQFLFF